jgi:hypothetical protein
VARSFGSRSIGTGNQTGNHKTEKETAAKRLLMAYGSRTFQHPVSDNALKFAAQKQKPYLQTQMGTAAGTITKIDKKKGYNNVSQPLQSNNVGE